MKKLTHGQLMQIRMSQDDVQEADRFPVSVLLTNVRSLYNVGSIFRTCDAALVSELILCGFTPYPPRTEIEKTALGAVDTVPWKYFANATDGIDYLRQKGYKIFAVEITDSSRSYISLREQEYPFCLVLGNELTGIDNEILNICDEAIEIEMHGHKHSLNVSVAAGIVIFEAIRNCTKKDRIIK